MNLTISVTTLPTGCIDPRINFYECSSDWTQLPALAHICLFFSIYSFMAVAGTLTQRWTKHGITYTTLPDVMSFQLLACCMLELIHYGFLVSYQFNNYPNVAIWRLLLFAERFMLIALIGVYVGVAGQLFGIGKSLDVSTTSLYGYIFYYTTFIPLLALIIIECALSFNPDNLYVDLLQSSSDTTRNDSFHIAVSIIISTCFMMSGVFLFLAVRNLDQYVKRG